MVLICKYCGKEIGNAGCLALHERRCKKNPNYKPTEKQQLKLNKKLNKQKYICSDETKEKISKSRKKWLFEHKEQHVWKRNTKFKSVPCENVKQFLTDNNINFVPEYTPFEDVNYCIDIAFPHEKIGIEINGNQHYDKNGNLSQYYQQRHDLFIERGWKLYEVHYTKCFDINNSFFKSLLNLNLKNENCSEYIKEQKLRKNKRSIERERLKQEQEQKKIDEFNYRRNILINAHKNSNIDFSKSGWSKKLYIWLLNRNELFNKMIFRAIKFYYPEFFEDNIWTRKGTVMPG